MGVGNTYGEKDANPRKNDICRGERLKARVDTGRKKNTELRRAYGISAGAEDRVNGVESIDNRFEPLEQLGITIPESVEREGLFLEYSEDRIQRPASIDGGSHWVIAEILAGSFGVLVQGSVEEGFEVGGGGGGISR